MKKIAIFASGAGTNAENIANYFSNRNDVKIEIILSNKKDALVLQKAKALNINFLSFDKKDFYENKKILNLLLEKNIDLIVLAGFLWLVPKNIVDNFRIMNIHPALLPKYGGKGMYGNNVHESVIKNKEKFSGITIHYVNLKYDDGDIIFQAQCPVFGTDKAEDLAQRIHKLEYEFFPKIIDDVVSKF